MSRSLLIVTFCLLQLSTFAANAVAQNRLLELHCMSVIPTGSAPDEVNAKGLSLYVRQIDGQWKQGLLLAPNFNSNYHTARVIKVDESDDAITLTLSADLLDDPWVKGGRARFNFQLTKGEKDTLQGEGTGSLNGIESKGRAKGWLMPLPDLSSQAKAGEHPRLLIRKQDLPQIKTWAKTPLGQAAVQQMTSAAGLGLRYQITDDKSLAEQSRKIVENIMADKSSGSKEVAHRVWAWRSEEVALAYDLCYDAWPAEFRQEVEQYLAGIADRVFFNHGSFTEYSGWRLNDRIGVGLIYGPCVASLAIVGEKGDAPTAIPAPYLNGHDPEQPLPAEKLEGDGLPINTFADDKMPAHWLFTGGLKPGSKSLDLAKLSQLRLKPNDKVVLGEASGNMQAYPDEGKWNDRLDIVGANGHAYFTSNVLYTIIRNDETRWVRFDGGFDVGIQSPVVLFAGTRIYDGDVFKLEKGDYPLLMVLPVSQTNPWGKISAQPRLMEISNEQAKTLMQRLIREADDRRADAQAAWDHYKETGQSAHYEKLYRLSEGLMYATFRHTLGDGGFQHGYGDLNNMLIGPMKFAAAYQRMHGVSVSPRPDVTHVLARRVMTLIPPKEGAGQIDDINGNAGFDLHAWFEGRDVTNETFACLLPITPAALQPALRTAWLKENDAVDASTATALLQGGRNQVSSTDTRMMNSHAAWVLTSGILNETKGKDLPLFWQADSDGWVAFRNAFDGPDDFVVQIFAKERLAQKWNRENAGAVRISGLDEQWMVGPANHESLREFESVPFYAGKWWPNGRGKIESVKYDKEQQQLFVSINLDELYQLPKQDDFIDTYEGSLTPEGIFTDQGIHARRKIAVDFSGKSGLPCLVVIYDEFKNAKADHEWVYQIESRQEDYGKWAIVDANGKVQNNKQIKKLRDQTGSRSELPEGYEWKITRDGKVPEEFTTTVKAEIATDGNQFKLQKGGKTLTGILLTAEGNPVEEKKVSILRKMLHGHSHGVSRIGSWSLRASSRTGFLCVIAIGEEELTEAHVTGNGLNSKVTIGKRTVQLVDGQIELGQAE